jgi:hypothetical protein
MSVVVVVVVANEAQIPSIGRCGTTQDNLDRAASKRGG